MPALIALLVFVLVVWLAFWIIGQMTLPEPIGLVARIIVGVLALAFLFQHYGGFAGLRL